MVKLIELRKSDITYNAYLYNNILIDTVPVEFSDELLKVLDGEKIEYIVINHSEPDHTGAVAGVLERYPQATVIGTTGTVRNLKEIINRDFKSVTAKEGQSFMGLTFKVMPVFPWPDTMVTYIAEEKIIFSGKMFASYKDEDLERFRDENIPYYETYSEYAIDELKKLDIKRILPAHGTEISDIKSAMDLYTSEKSESNTISVIYSSNYGYTKELAMIAVKEAEKYGDARLVNADCESTDEIIDISKAVMIGTPTINRGIPKCIFNAINNADSIKLMGKPVMIFGSYGWSGEALGNLSAVLRTLKADVFEKPFRCIFSPDEKKKQEFREFVNRFLTQIGSDADA